MNNLWLFEYETLYAMRTDARAVAASEHNDNTCKVAALMAAEAIHVEIMSRENAARIRS
jgi:hypothetical protein